MKTKYINDIGRGLVQVLTETDNSGTTQAVYNYGNDLISMNRSGVNSFYHYDGLGTVKQLTDSSETVAASYVYDAFGNLITSSGSVNNTYGFTGEQQFAEADSLVFLRASYYNPSVGRFISKDPIGYEGGLNLYRYVRNNPVIYKDPSGLAEWEYTASRCFLAGTYGWLWQGITGNCPYVCLDYYVKCGKVIAIPNVREIPESSFPGNICPITFFAKIIVDLPPGYAKL